MSSNTKPGAFKASTHGSWAAIKWLQRAVTLFIGVTALSFLLIANFSTDLVYTKLGKNPTPEQIDSLRHELGYDRPWIVRYGYFLLNLARGDLGYSDRNGERVASVLARTIPISLALLIPGFILGHLLGIVSALWAAWQRGRWADHFITLMAVAGMSLSFPVAIILAQWGLSSYQGLAWFPVQGWAPEDIASYLYYVTVPTTALLLVTVGYNTRFYRTLMVEELDKDYVLTARAYGAGALVIMARHVLPNTLIPIVTRVVFTLPSLVVGGSLLLENYFAIPGIGKTAFEAVTYGDQNLLLAIVALTALIFVVLNLSIDTLYRWFDPRLSTPVAA
ncbi:MAG: ABC transporter permease [Xanthomonadales bacterium]|nr:ABC transporter permease [Xanthomonadales bacterium]